MLYKNIHTHKYQQESEISSPVSRRGQNGRGCVVLRNAIRNENHTANLFIECIMMHTHTAQLLFIYFCFFFAAFLSFQNYQSQIVLEKERRRSEIILYLAINK